MESDNLADTEKLAWQLLASRDFQVVALASVRHDNQPEVRHLVLRDVDMSARTLEFWTDMRSDKIASIMLNSKVSVSAYSAKHASQISCLGQVNLHNKDRLAEERWHQATPYNKMIYSQIAPGTRLKARLQETEFTTGLKPNNENTKIGYENFCLLRIVLSEMDYLYLERSGNSRAHFIYGDEQNLMDAKWLA